MEGNSKKMRRSNQIPYHLMLLPGVVLVTVYCYIPMTGIIMAFEDFKPGKGINSIFFSSWVGLKHFEHLIKLPDAFQVLLNTLSISSMKMVLGLVIPIIVALMLNEVRSSLYRRTVQTAIYLPYFISWVLFAGILIDILSPGQGVVAKFLGIMRLKAPFFLGDSSIFPFTLVVSDVFKNFGFGTIIFMAAIAGIDPSIYEAAYIDGCSYLKRIWHITLPGISPIIIVVALLSLGNLLSAGFEQVFNLYSPSVYETGDIIDTYVYRLGIMAARYSLATAVGLGKSIVSMILISTSYYLAYKLADYKIF